MLKYINILKTNMKLVLILSLLAGWLISELKDFLTNGGIGNILAFSLLKIIFISVFILGLGGMLGVSHVIVAAFKEIISNYTWVPITPDDLTYDETQK